jgi:hypothetical protein
MLVYSLLFRGFDGFEFFGDLDGARVEDAALGEFEVLRNR